MSEAGDQAIKETENANGGLFDSSEVAAESIDGETTSFSMASSAGDLLEIRSDISEVSSTPTDPGYFLLDWRAEMTPGAVSV